MSGYNDYNTNQLGGNNSEQKYDTAYQTGNDANTMSGLRDEQAGAGYGSSAAAGPTAGNMNASGFDDNTQGSGMGMMGAERTGMGYGQGSTGGGDFRDDFGGSGTERFGESQGYGSGARDTSDFNTSSSGGYGQVDPEITDAHDSAGTGGHKPSMMDKLRGTTEKMGGKMTGNPEMTARGEERKRGEF